MTEQGLAESRQKAQAIIMAGQVFVNGQKVDKAGAPVPDNAVIEVRGKTLKYVSRGGLKLEKAMQCWPIVLEHTICADIGASLGCGAVMAELERTETGGFSIEKSYTLEALQEKDTQALHEILIPTESLFETLPTVQLPSFYERLFRSGCEIYLKKAKLSEYPIGTRLRVLDSKGKFFALGEIKNYENGLALKSIKLFVL